MDLTSKNIEALSKTFKETKKNVDYINTLLDKNNIIRIENILKDLETIKNIDYQTSINKQIKDIYNLLKKQNETQDNFKILNNNMINKLNEVTIISNKKEEEAAEIGIFEYLLYGFFTFGFVSFIFFIYKIITAGVGWIL